jgi:hypothetical protein
LPSLETAIRLSPFDPLMWIWQHWRGRAEYFAGHFEDAVATSRALCDERPLRPAYQTLIASLVEMERIAEARATVAEALAKVHDMAVFGNSREVRPADAERLRTAFRRAGLIN